MRSHVAMMRWWCWLIDANAHAARWTHARWRNAVLWLNLRNQIALCIERHVWRHGNHLSYDVIECCRSIVLDVVIGLCVHRTRCDTMRRRTMGDHLTFNVGIDPIMCDPACRHPASSKLYDGLYCNIAYTYGSRHTMPIEWWWFSQKETIPRTEIMLRTKTIQEGA